MNTGKERFREGVVSHSKGFEGLDSTSPLGRRYGNEFRKSSVTVDEGAIKVVGYTLTSTLFVEHM